MNALLNAAHIHVGKRHTQPIRMTQMKPNLMLPVASLLSLLLLTFHLAHDIVRGFEPGGLQNLVGGVLIAGVWLYATLMLSERRSGYIIMLLGSLLSIF